MTEQAAENPPAGPADPSTDSSQAPPWGSDAEFDAEKAWNLIQGLRSDKEKLASRPVLDEDAQRKLSEYERLEQASKTELERATEEMSRWQSEAEKWRTASVGSRIEALAAPDFADPSDAAAALSDPAKYLDAGGQIDEKAIKADLASVLERKPHWRRQPEQAASRLPQPSPHQGSGTNGRPSTDPANEFAAIIQGQLGPS